MNSSLDGHIYKRAHRKLIQMFWNFLEVFVNQKILNVHEHTVKKAHITVSSKSHQEEGRDGGKREKELPEVDTKVVSEGQSESIGKFKIVAGRLCG